MSDTNNYFENKYINPYIDKCVQESGYGDISSYKSFLQNCFCTHQNDINNGQRGNPNSNCDSKSPNTTCRAPDISEMLVQQCIADWTNQYKDMLSPILKDIQANANAASTAETSSINDAIQARKAGINAGMGKARAGLLGDATSNTNTSNVYNNAYSASIQNQGNTQADYLQKMGQATAAECQAKNMQNGAIINAIGGAMQGAGQGASLGASFSTGSTGSTGGK